MTTNGPAKLNVEKLGSKSFGMLKVTLEPNQWVTVEPGAMASHDSNIEIRTQMNGGFFNALILKFLGKESFFINILSMLHLILIISGNKNNNVIRLETKFAEIICITPGL